MTKRLSKFVFATILVLVATMSMILLTACGTNFVTVNIQQDVFDRYIIEDGKTLVKVKSGDNLSLSYEIGDNYDYTEEPQFNIIADDGTHFEYDIDLEKCQITIKNITKDITVSLMNPPTISHTVEFYNGNDLLGTYYTGANQLISAKWLDEIQAQNTSLDDPYLVGLYTNVECTQSFDPAEPLSDDAKIYTKWNFAPYLFVANTPNVDVLAQGSDITLVEDVTYLDYQIFEQRNDAGSTCRFMVKGTSELHIYNMFGTSGEDLVETLVTSTQNEGGNYVYTLDATKITHSMLISF